MRLLSRDFTVWEKIVLLILVLALMGLGYYRFIDQPVRQGIEEAHAQRDKLLLDLADVDARVQAYIDRVDEMQQAKELRHAMPSYNGSEEELRILNDALDASQNYAFNVDKITLSGNQIRRNFTFTFSTPSFESAQGIFSRLSNSRVRCLIGNVDCGGIAVTESGAEINIRADGTFYETLEGATLDAPLSDVLNQQGRELPKPSEQT